MLQRRLAAWLLHSVVVDGVGGKMHHSGLLQRRAEAKHDLAELDHVWTSPSTLQLDMSRPASHGLLFALGEGCPTNIIDDAVTGWP